MHAIETQPTTGCAPSSSLLAGTPYAGRIALRLREVAEVCGMATSTAYDLAARGHIPTVVLGRTKRVLVSDLERWVRGE